MIRLTFNALAFLLAVSYLVAGTLNPSIAHDLWAPYAIVTGAVACINLVLERRRG